MVSLALLCWEQRVLAVIAVDNSLTHTVVALLGSRADWGHPEVSSLKLKPSIVTKFVAVLVSRDMCLPLCTSVSIVKSI